MSHAAGVVCLAKPGERVEKGQPVLELHVDDPSKVGAALDALEGAFEVAAEPPAPHPIVLECVGAKACA